MKMFLKTWAPSQNITHNNMDSWPPLVGISLQEKLSTTVTEFINMTFHKFTLINFFFEWKTILFLKVGT